MEYSAYRVKCPFYQDGEQKKIRCEGIGDAASLFLAFSTGQKKKVHQETYCESVERCRGCPVNKMLREKYGE